MAVKIAENDLGLRDVLLHLLPFLAHLQGVESPTNTSCGLAWPISIISQMLYGVHFVSLSLQQTGFSWLLAAEPAQVVEHSAS